MRDTSQDAVAARNKAANTVGENEAQLAAAKLLIFSSDRKQREQGIMTLDSLLCSGFKPSECAYWLVVGYLNAGEYRACRQQIAGLVRAEPTNERAAALLEVVKDKIRAEGQRSWLIAGGVAVALGIVLYFAWGRGGRGGDRDDEFSAAGARGGGYGRGNGSNAPGSGSGYYRNAGGSGSSAGTSPGSVDIANSWKARYGR